MDVGVGDHGGTIGSIKQFSTERRKECCVGINMANVVECTCCGLPKVEEFGEDSKICCCDIANGCSSLQDALYGVIGILESLID